jgi:hypothetical protein
MDTELTLRAITAARDAEALHLIRVHSAIAEGTARRTPRSRLASILRSMVQQTHARDEETSPTRPLESV